MLAPVVANRTVEGPARARRRTEAKTRKSATDIYGGQLSSSHRTAFGDLPTSSVSAVHAGRSNYGFCGDLRERDPNPSRGRSELRTDAGAAARSLGDGSGVGLVKLYRKAVREMREHHLVSRLYARQYYIHPALKKTNKRAPRNKNKAPKAKRGATCDTCTLPELRRASVLIQSPRRRARGGEAQRTLAPREVCA